MAPHEEHAEIEDRLALALDELEERVARGAAPDLTELSRRHEVPRERLERLERIAASLALVEGAAQDTHAVPERLGEFRLRGELGRGGMGVVYLAEQERLGRAVALKVVPATLALDARFLERFKREAQAAARLAHPNIVPVYEVGSSNGIHYYSMARVEGCSLAQLLTHLEPSRSESASDGSKASAVVRRIRDRAESIETTDAVAESPLAYAEIARILMEVADAIAHAHAQGVLHRDVKPGNVMLDLEGRAHVTDFGLCRVAGMSDLTVSGELVGTLRYMAPEQVDGEPTTRSDVYGLGALLYELLTLRPAQTATRRSQLVNDVLHRDPPRPRSIDARIPVDLETIACKALAKLPEQRYATAVDMARDLEAFIDGSPIAARPPSAAYLTRLFVKRNRVPLAFAATGVLGIAAVTAKYIMDLGRAGEMRTRQAYVADLAAAEAALSAGAVTRAFGHLRSAPEELRSWEWRHLAARADQSVARVAPFDTRRESAAVEFHPTDSRVLASDEGSLAIFDRDSGDVLARREQEGFLYGVWSEDGEHVVAGLWESKLVLLDGRTLEPTGVEVETVDTVARIVTATEHVIAFATRRGIVGLWDLRSGEASTLSDSLGKVLWLGYEENGGEAGARVVALTVDGVLHELRPFGPDSRRSIVTGEMSEVIAADVDLAADCAVASFRSGAVLWIDLSSGVVRRTLAPGAPTLALRLDAEHRRVLTAGEDSIVRVWHLDDLDTPDELVGHVDDVCELALSRDGEWIATADELGEFRTWSARQPGGTHVLRGHINDAWQVALHPDGIHGATSGRDGLVILWNLRTAERTAVIPEASSGVCELEYTANGALLYALGTDGDLIAFDAGTGVVVHRRGAPAGAASDFALDEAGERLFVTTPNAVEVLSLDLSRVIARWATDERPARQLVLDPARRWLAVGDDAGVLRLHGLERGELLSSADVLEKAVYALAFDPESDRFAVTSMTSAIALVEADAPHHVEIL